ncbi:MAG: DUF3108 domain-containing protein [Pseudomonadota bacterium]
MKGLAVGALALAGLLLAPDEMPAARADTPAAADGAPTALSYQIYFGGFKALAFEVEIGLSRDAYQLRLRGHTEGVVDWILDWTTEATTQGLVADGGLRPLRHSSESLLRGNRRDAALAFHPDGAIDTTVEPSAEADEREPVTAAEARGAFDPISAILIASRALGAQQSCDQRLPVYDGRRRYDLEFRDGGRELLKPSEYSSFSGEATLCLFRYIRIAGYQKSGGRWSNPRDVDRVYRAWLAPVAPGLPPLPVRIEAEGTFGDLIVHLVGTRRPEG